MMRKRRLIFLVVLTAFRMDLAQTSGPDEGDTGLPAPIVLWHGMGDSCCNPLSLGYLQKILEKNLPKVHVHSLRIGHNFEEDTLNGFFMPVMDQVALACEHIKNDTRLRHGYNALGFSQGAQFLRAVAQVCPQGMKKLISFGGQHQGVYGIPKCIGENYRVCDYVRRLLNYGAYEPWIQKRLVQAQYWHDPLDEDAYRSKSLFLAKINNEKAPRDETYKKNLVKLERLVLIKFTHDTMVDPKGSEWFSYYRPGQSEEILPFNETLLYKEDLIGLKMLNEMGKVDFLEVDGDHLQISEKYFVHDIIRKYLLQ